jgi:hypothetical protein
VEAGNQLGTRDGATQRLPLPSTECESFRGNIGSFHHNAARLGAMGSDHGKTGAHRASWGHLRRSRFGSCTPVSAHLRTALWDLEAHPSLI